MILGLGHDVVDMEPFAQQLAGADGGMRSLFSMREYRQAQARASLKHDAEAVHLAVKWAGKEAVIKAWSAALGEFEAPYTIDHMPWQRIEILDDAQGRPHVVLAADVDRRLAESVRASSDGKALAWLLSLSHDGPIASAVALLQLR